MTIYIHSWETSNHALCESGTSRILHSKAQDSLGSSHPDVGKANSADPGRTQFRPALWGTSQNIPSWPVNDEWIEKQLIVSIPVSSNPSCKERQTRWCPLWSSTSTWKTKFKLKGKWTKVWNTCLQRMNTVQHFGMDLSSSVLTETKETIRNMQVVDGRRFCTTPATSLFRAEKSIGHKVSLSVSAHCWLYVICILQYSADHARLPIAISFLPCNPPPEDSCFIPVRTKHEMWFSDQAALPGNPPTGTTTTQQHPSSQTTRQPNAKSVASQDLYQQTGVGFSPPILIPQKSSWPVQFLPSRTAQILVRSFDNYELHQQKSGNVGAAKTEWSKFEEVGVPDTETTRRGTILNTGRQRFSRNQLESNTAPILVSFDMFSTNKMATNENKCYQTCNDATISWPPVIDDLKPLPNYQSQWMSSSTRTRENGCMTRFIHIAKPIGEVHLPENLLARWWHRASSTRQCSCFYTSASSTSPRQLAPRKTNMPCSQIHPAAHGHNNHATNISWPTARFSQQCHFVTFFSVSTQGLLQHCSPFLHSFIQTMSNSKQVQCFLVHLLSALGKTRIMSTPIPTRKTDLAFHEPNATAVATKPTWNSQPRLHKSLPTRFINFVHDN